MATTEKQRWTDRVCPACGAWIRVMGSLWYNMGVCSAQCEAKEMLPVEKYPTLEQYMERNKKVLVDLEDLDDIEEVG